MPFAVDNKANIMSSVACKYRGTFDNCHDKIVHLPTDEGVCITFNPAAYNDTTLNLTIGLAFTVHVLFQNTSFLKAYCVCRSTCSQILFWWCINGYSWVSQRIISLSSR